MVLIALVLIAAGGAATVGLLLGGNTDAVTVTVFDRTLPETTVLAVFAAGAATMLVIVTGISILRGTARRSLERRRELQDLEEEHEESMRRLEDENVRLQRELERTRSTETQHGLLPPTVDTYHQLTPEPTVRPPLPPALPSRGIRGADDPWADLRDDVDANPPGRSGPYGL